MLIGGEAGVGKTALVNAFCAEVPAAILRKLAVKTQGEASVKAVRLGLVS
jgi:DNA transposition AAA+ family ATPase